MLVVLYNKRWSTKWPVFAAILLPIAILAAIMGPCEPNDQQLGPTIPLQFSADVDITSYLVDRTVDYPPWQKHMKIHYDYPKGFAKVTIKEGLEPDRTFIRRYNEKNEYMVKSGEFAKCQRAYLGETMPVPEIPSKAKNFGIVDVNGKQCTLWLIEHPKERVQYYEDADTQVPVRLTIESGWDSIYTPLLSYDYRNVKVGEQADELFSLPEIYTHESCERTLTGFPYVHALHNYLRF